MHYASSTAIIMAYECPGKKNKQRKKKHKTIYFSLFLECAMSHKEFDMGLNIFLHKNPNVKTENIN